MADLEKVTGFQDERPPPRRPVYARATVLGPAAPIAQKQAVQRARIAAGAPEAVLIARGRPNDLRTLGVHFRYITRNGALELEDQDGVRLSGARAVAELAQDWIVAGRARHIFCPRARLAYCMVLSAPAGSEPSKVEAAGRALARRTFAERFDFVFVLHTDTAHPHLHLTVCAQAHDKGRLIPSFRDVVDWRATFAEALCEHGIEAVASRCSERGRSSLHEPIGLRKLRELYDQGLGPIADVDRAAIQAAAGLAFLGQSEPTPGERRMRKRHGEVRASWLAEAERLKASSDPADRALADQIRVFVADMPGPASRREQLARDLIAINEALVHERGERAQPARERQRSR